jgi:subtilisin-like proprotein convertase family protein
VTWDVANTDKVPIGAQKLTLYLSLDGGLTFPITLAEDVVNDGEHEVILPGVATTEARIMVKASDNIFFAVNTSDFTIEEAQVVLNFTELDFEVCQPDDLTIPFNYETFSGFNEEVTFSASGAPAGLGISFTPGTATADDTPVDLVISNTGGVAAGNYPVTVTATSATLTKEVIVNLHISNGTFSDVTLSAPADGATQVSLNQQLEWVAEADFTSYDVEIATDAAFNLIIESATVSTNTYLVADLEGSTTYFWRVKPKNTCGEGTFGTPFGFRTVDLSCNSISAAGLPLTISDTGTPTVTSRISFLNDLSVSDVNVTLDLEHSFLADLIISLTSPSGTTVILTSNSCGELTDIDAVFDHEANNFICGGNPGISGTVKPLGSLASFNGESTFGEWILEIQDIATADGGSLNTFSLEICAEGQFRPDNDGDGVFDDGDDLCLNTPPGTEVDTDGCPVFRFPPDNFRIAIESESCIGNDDGKINIIATQSMEYIVALTGNGFDLSANFTDSFQFDDLQAGTYDICITGTDGGIVFEAICFEAIVSQPEQLGVSSVIDQNNLLAVITLTGSDLYTIELNGQLMQVETSEVVLNLKDGANTLKVSTNLPCQGIYEEQIFVSDRPIIYPNPFATGPMVFLGRRSSSVEVAVHDANGRLIRKNNYKINDSELDLNLGELPSGIYFVSLKAEGIRSSHKVIRR